MTLLFREDKDRSLLHMATVGHSTPSGNASSSSTNNSNSNSNSNTNDEPMTPPRLTKRNSLKVFQKIKEEASNNLSNSPFLGNKKGKGMEEEDSRVQESNKKGSNKEKGKDVEEEDISSDEVIRYDNE